MVKYFHCAIGAEKCDICKDHVYEIEVMQTLLRQGFEGQAKLKNKASAQETAQAILNFNKRQENNGNM